MIPRAFRRIVVVVMGALALTHCSQNPFTAGRGGEQRSAQEILAAAQAHQEVLQEYAALDNPTLQAYVNEVGQRLAQQSRRPQLPWHFTVLDSSDVNAFALPGGYVYVTRGIMGYLNSEAELAGVIGHQIGHVTARHGMNLQSAPAAAGLGSVLGAEPNKQAGAALLQTLAQAWTAGYGREQELEADRLGAQILAKAGYDPQAMIEVSGALNRQARFAAEQARRDSRSAHTYHGAFDTPGNDARLQQEVDQTKRHAVANPRDGRSDYLQKIEGLIFGDNPEQGVIRNNLLLHEKLGLALQFPPGWLVRNRPDRVVATSPLGDALVELRPGPQNDQPLQTLQHGVKLDAGARYDSGRLGGYPAAFAAGAQQGKPVVAAAVLLDGTQYLVAGVARDKPAYERERSALRAAINSFRAITPAERKAARPYRLQLVTAQPGTTMASLARQSPLGAEAESQLRLLNDLYPDGEPQPGQLLKIVQ